MAVTAKFKVNWVSAYGEEQTKIDLLPDYNDERNKAWSQYTPSGLITLYVRNEVAPRFPLNHNFLVTFEDEDAGSD